MNNACEIDVVLLLLELPDFAQMWGDMFSYVMKLAMGTMDQLKKLDFVRIMHDSCTLQEAAAISQREHAEHQTC